MHGAERIAARLPEARAATVTYEELLAEYEGPQRIGEHIWAVVIEVTGRVCRRYPPRVYADDSQWNEASIADLAQSVALERLIGESQLDYIFMRAGADPARGLETVRGLLAVQVQRALASRRAPTVVDRIIRRIAELLQDPPSGLGSRAIGSDTWIYGASERTPAELAPTDRHRGVHRIADIPRIPSNPRGERESKVYGSRQLVDALRRLCEEYEGIYLSDVRRILEDLLTSWLPEVLYVSEAEDHRADPPPSHLELTEMSTQLQALLDRLTYPHVVVMIGKSNGASDTQLATQLECSRPTIIKYKREYTEVIGQFLLDEVPADRHAVAMEILLEHAVDHGQGQHDGPA